MSVALVWMALQWIRAETVSGLSIVRVVLCISPVTDTDCFMCSHDVESWIGGIWNIPCKNIVYSRNRSILAHRYILQDFLILMLLPIHCYYSLLPVSSWLVILMFNLPQEMAYKPKAQGKNGKEWWTPGRWSGSSRKTGEEDEYILHATGKNISLVHHRL